MKLTRRLSFLGLFASAAAAQAPVGEGGSRFVDTGMGTHTVRPWESEKPKNGQCPLCGKMAEKYVRPMVPDWSKATHTNCYPVNAYLEACDAAPTIAVGDNPRLNRCARCSNAFWQDAEPA